MDSASSAPEENMMTELITDSGQLTESKEEITTLAGNTLPPASGELLPLPIPSPLALPADTSSPLTPEALPTAASSQRVRRRRWQRSTSPTIAANMPRRLRRSQPRRPTPYKRNTLAHLVNELRQIDLEEQNFLEEERERRRLDARRLENHNEMLKRVADIRNNFADLLPRLRESPSPSPPPVADE